MIVIDSSALIAILDNEPERAAFASIIAHAERRLLSTVNALEAALVLYSRRGAEGVAQLDSLICDSEIELVPFDQAQRDLAIKAFALYGKGIHARARLNMGDCVAYALAKGLNLPLLFKGNDFAATDLTPAHRA